MAEASGLRAAGLSPQWPRSLRLRPSRPLRVNLDRELAAVQEADAFRSRILRIFGADPGPAGSVFDNRRTTWYDSHRTIDRRSTMPDTPVPTATKRPPFRRIVVFVPLEQQQAQG